MAFQVADGVMETSTTTGTGTLTLAGAVTGYSTFGAVATGSLVNYSIVAVDANGNPSGDREDGIGTYTAAGTTLSRDFVLSTLTGGTYSTANAKLTLAAGTKRVFISPLANVHGLPILENGLRLSLTTAVPVTTADVTAALVLYWTPYLHNRCSLPINGSAWVRQAIAEQSIKATDSAQTGTMTNGGATITGLTSTAQLVRGMKVTGTSVGAAAVINSIDSATQVTVSVNSTGSTSNAVTFKLPASKAYDVFAVPLTSTTMRIQFGTVWTNNTTRAVAVTYANALDGVLVNDAVIASGDSNSIAAKAGLYLGTIYTTTTDGQMEDSGGGVTTQVGGKRYVWNLYNQSFRTLQVYDFTDSWVYNNTLFRQVNGASGNKVEAVIGITGACRMDLTATSFMTASGITGVRTGIGEDSTTVNSATARCTGVIGVVNDYASMFALMQKLAPLGYHAWNWLESSHATPTCTWYGDNGDNTVDKNGISGGLMG